MASTSDLTGALAAIEARLAENWTATPVVYDNIDPNPDADPSAGTAPWVFVELLDVDSEIIGFGTPGNQTVADHGLIKMLVMVRKGAGLSDGRAKAVALGEIFRQQEFYTSDPTAYVRTGTPRVGRGSMVSDDGNWISMECSVPFRFYHRA